MAYELISYIPKNSKGADAQKYVPAGVVGDLAPLATMAGKSIAAATENIGLFSTTVLAPLSERLVASSGGVRRYTMTELEKLQQRVPSEKRRDLAIGAAVMTAVRGVSDYVHSLPAGTDGQRQALDRNLQVDTRAADSAVWETLGETPIDSVRVKWFPRASAKGRHTLRMAAERADGTRVVTDVTAYDFGPDASGSPELYVAVAALDQDMMPSPMDYPADAPAALGRLLSWAAQQPAAA